MTTYIQTKQPDTSHRLAYVDMAKGIGMLAIIWGHIMLSGWSNNLVYSFHIPLFFFLSGMMFNGSKYADFGSLVKRRAKTLLLPYLMFSFVTWLLWAILSVVSHSGANLFRPLLQTFIAQGSGGFMVHNVPLWFVTCLFVVEVIYYFVQKLPDWANVLICIVCALIGDYMIRGGHLSFFRLLPWNIEGAMSALLFYALVNLLIKNCSHQKVVDTVNNNWITCILIIIILTICLFFSANWNGHITLGSNSLGKNTMVFYINAFIGILTTISLSILLSKVTDKAIIKIPLRYIQWFGENSFFVMASHVPVKSMLILMISKIAHLTPIAFSKSIKLSLLAFLLTLIVDSVVVFLIAKLKKHDEALVQKLRKTK